MIPPCATRAATSIHGPVDIGQAADAPVKTPRPMTHTRLCPTRSPRRAPLIRTRAARPAKFACRQGHTAHMTTRYADLLRRCETDPDVVGLVLSGSHARDMATEHSDFDVYVIL